MTTALRMAKTKTTVQVMMAVVSPSSTSPVTFGAEERVLKWVSRLHDVFVDTWTILVILRYGRGHCGYGEHGGYGGGGGTGSGTTCGVKGS